MKTLFASLLAFFTVCLYKKHNIDTKKVLIFPSLSHIAVDCSVLDFNSVFSNSNIKLPTSLISIHALQRKY